MNVLRYLIQKEFIQIFRNKAILPMMTILPILQLLVLTSAASNEVKLVNMVVLDLDQSEFSRTLLQTIRANERFKEVGYPLSHKEAFSYLESSAADIVLEIPKDFEKHLMRKEGTELQLLINATNGQQATIGSGYLGAIIRQFNKGILPKISAIPKTPAAQLAIHSRYWYNPDLAYDKFMAPGILAQLTALLTIILSAMNTVRERELGTIEQLNVTPIKKWQFILGKLVPFLCIGIVLVIVGITFSKLIFSIPIRGSIFLLLGYAILNIIAVLGLGLFISNFANTQQQAIFVAFFFIIIFVLMSGLFTPIDSMPIWAQKLTIPNPLAHFISVSRKVLMKGSGIWDIRFEILYTLILALFFNSIAIWSYKKQV